jgi:hypothetical protein
MALTVRAPISISAVEWQVRQPVEFDAFRIIVVGAYHRGVAAGVAAADPAFFQHGHPGDAVILGQVIGRSQPMAAAADDDRIVGRLRLG